MGFPSTGRVACDGDGSPGTFIFGFAGVGGDVIISSAPVVFPSAAPATYPSAYPTSSPAAFPSAYPTSSPNIKCENGISDFNLVKTKPSVAVIGTLTSFAYNVVGLVPLNIDAVLKPDCPDIPAIQSVKMTFDNPSRARCEQYVPYAVFGNRADGTVSFGQSIPLGTRTVTATAYTGPNCDGELVDSISREFVVSGCPLSYAVYNAATDSFVTNLVDGGTITNPPCKVNIKIDVLCGSAIDNVRSELFKGTTRIANRSERTEPYFLFGNNGTDVFAGTIASGTYKLTTKINGIEHPSITFTFSGACTP